MSELDAMSANAAADELDKLIERLDAEAKRQAARDDRYAQGKADGLEYAGTLLFRQAAEWRELAKQRAEQSEATLRAVRALDRARNYGIGQADE